MNNDFFTKVNKKDFKCLAMPDGSVYYGQLVRVLVNEDGAGSGVEEGSRPASRSAMVASAMSNRNPGDGNKMMRLISSGKAKIVTDD